MRQKYVRNKGSRKAELNEEGTNKKKSKSMVQDPFKGNSCLAGQEFAHILWHPKFHYPFTRTCNWTLFKSSLNLSQFSKIYSDIILPSVSRSLKWSLPFRSRHVTTDGQSVCQSVCLSVLMSDVSGDQI
jgi:hypothetical protein